MNKYCDKCGKDNRKIGKLAGIAAIQSLSSKTGIGGSDLILTFCGECGNVIEMKVESPNKIK